MHDLQLVPGFDPSLDLRGVRLLQQPLLEHDDTLFSPWNALFVFLKKALVSAQRSVWTIWIRLATYAQLLVLASGWSIGRRSLSASPEDSPLPRFHVQQGIRQGQWRSCGSGRHERRGRGQRSCQRRCEYERVTSIRLVSRVHWYYVPPFCRSLFPGGTYLAPSRFCRLFLYSPLHVNALCIEKLSLRVCKLVTNIPLSDGILSPDAPGPAACWPYNTCLLAIKSKRNDIEG